jgi:hypothetical protein
MYEWSVLRAVAGVLLCLPLLHFALIATRDISAYFDPSPTVWADDISRYNELDLKRELPERPVLVVGGQRVRLWKDLPARLRGHNTLMRPLGDATLEDLTFHYDRLIGYYQPEVLVVFPGYADLHLRDEKSPEDFERAIRELLALDTSYDGASHRFVITPLQMPLHPEDHERVDAMAAVAERLQDELEDLTVIDPNPLLSDIGGRPDPSFYRGDGINLNAEGYARVTLLLQTAMRSQGLDLAQQKAD